MFKLLLPKEPTAFYFYSIWASQKRQCEWFIPRFNQMWSLSTLLAIVQFKRLSRGFPTTPVSGPYKGHCNNFCHPRSSAWGDISVDSRDSLANGLLGHFQMTYLLGIHPKLLAGRLENIGYFINIHSDLLVGRSKDVESMQVLSHTFQYIFPSLLGSRFAVQELLINYNCAYWICQYVYESHPKHPGLLWGIHKTTTKKFSKCIAFLQLNLEYTWEQAFEPCCET